MGGLELGGARGDLDVLEGQRASPEEWHVAAIGLLADVAEHPILNSAHDSVLNRVGVE